MPNVNDLCNFLKIVVKESATRMLGPRRRVALKGPA